MYRPIPYTEGPLCLEHWIRHGVEASLERCERWLEEHRKLGLIPSGFHDTYPHSPIDGGESIKYL